MPRVLPLTLILLLIVGSSVLPLPFGERAGVRGGPSVSDPDAQATSNADHPSPPTPLPKGERGEAIDQIDVALAAGLRFLLSQQADDGAWRSQIYGPFKDGGSLTPLALRTLFGVAPRDRLDSNRIVAGISYLVRMVRDDGLIDSTSGNITYPVYTAANAVVVLSRSRNPRHLAARDAWLAELRRRQLVEQLGWQRDDEAYGGWGYSSLLPKRPVSGKPATPLDEPNLSATAFALEALRAAGSREDDPAFRKALRFVQRCQNFSNDRDRDRKVRRAKLLLSRCRTTRGSAGASPSRIAPFWIENLMTADFSSSSTTRSATRRVDSDVMLPEANGSHRTAARRRTGCDASSRAAYRPTIRVLPQPVAGCETTSPPIRTPADTRPTASTFARDCFFITHARWRWHWLRCRRPTTHRGRKSAESLPRSPTNSPGGNVPTDRGPTPSCRYAKMTLSSRHRSPSKPSPRAGRFSTTGRTKRRRTITRRGRARLLPSRFGDRFDWPF